MSDEDGIRTPAEAIKSFEEAMAKPPESSEPEPTVTKYCCLFCNGYITEEVRVKHEIRPVFQPNFPAGTAEVAVKTGTYTCSMGRDNCSMLELYRRSTPR